MTRVLPVNAQAPHADAIRQAAEVLRAGGLVAFPTETVYGLGAHALDASAVRKIFAAKGRPSTDPVIVHLADASRIHAVAVDVPETVRVLGERFWPGPLTVVLKKSGAVPDEVSAGLSTVGVRVPNHAVAHALLRASAVPVAAPSANRFSRPSPTRAAHVLADLDGAIDLVLDAGETPIGVESTIVDLTMTPPLVRRFGGIALEALRAVIPDVEAGSAAMSTQVAQPAPGQLLRHYAPRAAMTLYLGDADAVAARIGADVRQAVASGQRVGVLAPEEDLRALAPRLAAIGRSGRVVTRRCGSRRDRAEAAHELFHRIRELDAEEVDVIYGSAPEGHGIDAAIVDRLTRASEGRVVRCT